MREVLREERDAARVERVGGGEVGKRIGLNWRTVDEGGGWSGRM